MLWTKGGHSVHYRAGIYRAGPKPAGANIENGANFTIGGTDTPAGNIIAFNKAEGVRIDPAYQGSQLTSNNGPNTVVGNTIFSNGAAGVEVASGTGNLVSQNSIYSNAVLGIESNQLDPLVNSNCQTNTNGANNLQNAPVLTPANGSSTLVSATATDPNGNTSEFSNCAAMAGSGGQIDIVGQLNSLPNTKYTIEFFQNAACDASGFGQGKTFLSKLNVMTNASCVASFNDPVNANQADLSLYMGYNTSLYSNYVDPGQAFTYTATVTNTGSGAATGVTFVNTLPASLSFTSASRTQGACGNTGNALTCNLGKLASGATAVVTIEMTVLAVGTISDSGSVSSSTADPNMANNSASLTFNSQYPLPTIDHFSPASAVAPAGNLALEVFGSSFAGNVTTLTVASTQPVNSMQLSYTLVNNQVCSTEFETYACQGLLVTVPASFTASPGTLTFTVTNPTPGGGSYALPFTVYPNPGTVTQFQISGIPNPALQNTSYNMTVTAENSTGQVVPGYRGILNLNSMYVGTETFDPPSPYQFTAGDNGVQTFSTSFSLPGSNTVTVQDAGTPGITGSLTVLVNPVFGPPNSLINDGTPDDTPIGYPFPQPLTVIVQDASLNFLLKEWTELAQDPMPDGFVFPSERITTPMSLDNLWRRCMLPKLEDIGLGWATFQVLRKTNASLSKKAGVDPKVAADQRGHGIGVSLEVYTSSDLDQKRAALKKLEAAVLRKPQPKRLSA